MAPSTNISPPSPSIFGRLLAFFAILVTFPLSVISALPSSLLSLLRRFDIQNGTTVSPSAIPPRAETLGVLIFGALFFSWGLAYGLLDIMNYHIKVAMGTDRASAALLAMAYYSAYLVAPPLIGGPLIKHAGYRSAAVVGLLFLAAGDQFMSLGAAKLAFPLMCFSHGIVGLGVSTLERCANAYVVNVGPRARGTLRILVAQSAAALGTVVAPLLANAVIFDPSSKDQQPAPDLAKPGQCLMPPPPAKGEAGDLGSVVRFYQILGTAIFVFAGLLAVLFFRTRLVVEPEIPTSPRLQHSSLKFWKHPLCATRHARLWCGWVANFLNLGCQVTVAQFFIEQMRVNACAGERQGAMDMFIAQILFLVGRLAAVGLIELPNLPGLRRSKPARGVLNPRVVLVGFLLGAVAFTGAGIGAKGTAAVVCACLVMFAEAPSFPMIFESATAGMGEWTSTAESIMIVSISGGGLLPLINGALTDHFGVSKSWGLATACFGVVSSYTIMCCVVPSFREEIDAAHGEHVSLTSGEAVGDVELHKASPRSETPMSEQA